MYTYIHTYILLVAAARGFYCRKQKEKYTRSTVPGMACLGWKREREERERDLKNHFLSLRATEVKTLRDK